MRDRIEEEFEVFWHAFRSVVEATDGDGDPDHRARYQAAVAAFAEAFGKPLQPTRDEGGMIFSHPLLSAKDIQKLNDRRGDASFSETPEG
jgi:LmbE family N-acetylglucosaminyl deacetylase